MSKYGAPASQGGQVFLPFVFETYGLWGKHFQDFFASTMKQAEEYRGIPGAAISMHWRRRISFTLHKTMAEACSFNIRCLCNQTRISSSSRMALDQSPRQNPRAAACVELPLHLRDIWSQGQTLPRLLRSDDEAGGGVPRISSAAISLYWRRRISVTLHKTMAEATSSWPTRLSLKYLCLPWSTALLRAFTSMQVRQYSSWANTVPMMPLTNPEGPYRLQPERVRFHPDPLTSPC